VRGPRLEISPALVRALVAEGDRLKMYAAALDDQAELPSERQVPQLFPCGCTAIKVSLNKCDVFLPGGEPRVVQAAPTSDDPRPGPVRDQSRVPVTPCGYTFGMLLHDLAKLQPEQLAMPVRWWGEDMGGRVAGLQQLEEDYAAGEEGCGPVSQFEPCEEEPTPTIVLVKGTPVLEVA
jgi:hypothetical protein